MRPSKRPGQAIRSGKALQRTSARTPPHVLELGWQDLAPLFTHALHRRFFPVLSDLAVCAIVPVTPSPCAIAYTVARWPPLRPDQAFSRDVARVGRRFRTRRRRSARTKVPPSSIRARSRRAIRTAARTASVHRSFRRRSNRSWPRVRPACACRTCSSRRAATSSRRRARRSTAQRVAA